MIFPRFPFIFGPTKGTNPPEVPHEEELRGEQRAKRWFSRDLVVFFGSWEVQNHPKWHGK
jgi:hypothetical protein